MAIMAKRGEIEVVDPNKVRIRGYAAVTGVEFDYFDPFKMKLRHMEIDPGAFTAALAELGGRPLPIYWSHQTHRYQIGETTTLQEDSVGLYFDGPAIANTEAIDALTTIAKRTRTGASMELGFGPIAERGGVEHIRSVGWLGEVGPTPQGANPLAWAEIYDAEEQAESEAPPAPAVNDIALARQIYGATAQLRRI